MNLLFLTQNISLSLKQQSIQVTFFLSRILSSLYAFSCFFHSSTLAVLSCRAAVSRALLFFSVCSSVSHFLALAELQVKVIHIQDYLTFKC